MIRTHPSIRRIARPLYVRGRHKEQTRYYATAPGRGRPKASNPHWAGDKLKTTEEFPLSLALSKTIHPNLDKNGAKRTARGNIGAPTHSAGGGGVHVRTQIVSPDLCDDVLSYIGHTLDQHKGCDILDINPGAGLWSQKLHAYLKPRSHVLLEPRPETFKEFLDPLLTQPDSKYSLWSQDPTDLETYRSMVANGAFPHQIPKKADDPKAQELNTSLLVTGSLMWDPRLPGMGFDSMAKQLYHHFASATWTNDLFHAFGVVRMLFWVQHGDFVTQVTESVSGMQKANRFLEMTHQLSLYVNPEYTARPITAGQFGREPQYKIESTVRALKSMRERGMELPLHRRDHIHHFAEDVETMSKGTGVARSAEVFEYLREQHIAGRSTVGLLSESATKLFSTEAAILAEHPGIEIKPAVKSDSASSSKAKYQRAKSSKAKDSKAKLEDPDAKAKLKDFYKKRSSVAQIQKSRYMIEAVADVGEEMYKLECKILGMEEGREKDFALEKLAGLDAQWTEQMALVPSNYTAVPENEVDERLSLRTPPYSRIQWDARPIEPLIMRRSETWPQNRVSLVDATPLPRPVAESPDHYEWMHDFVFGLYSRPGESIDVALDKMQHGLNDIIDECPSLKDPAKGGRLQMKHLRVRMLTMEMIGELVQAYMNWPFKAPGSDHKKYFWNRGSLSR